MDSERIFESVEPKCVAPPSHLGPSLATGKVSELLAMAKLLDMGHRLAVPVVDDDGVDFIVDYRIAVQVKATSGLSTPRHHRDGGHYRFDLRASGRIDADRMVVTRQARTMRADVYLFHGRPTDQWWVVPTWALREAGVKGRVAFRPERVVNSSQSRLLHGWLEAWHVFEREDLDA